MAEVLFYHLERQRLEDVLPTLLEKTLERGWRAVVQVADTERRDDLDRHLWTYRDDSFLPHATPGAGFAERQPIVLTCAADNPNSAEVRFLADGVAPVDIERHQRIVLLFSADDDAAVAAARAHWSPLKAAGHACTYWRQSAAGRWEQKG